MTWQSDRLTVLRCCVANIVRSGWQYTPVTPSHQAQLDLSIITQPHLIWSDQTSYSGLAGVRNIKITYPPLPPRTVRLCPETSLLSPHSLLSPPCRLLSDPPPPPPPPPAGRVPPCHLTANMWQQIKKRPVEFILQQLCFWAITTNWPTLVLIIGSGYLQIKYIKL